MSRYKIGNAKDSESDRMETISRYAGGRKGTIDESRLAQAAKDLNMDPEELKRMNIPVEKQRRGSD